MQYPVPGPLRLLLLAALAAIAPSAHAQHFLVAIDANGKPQLVKAAVTPQSGGNTYDNETAQQGAKQEVSADVEVPDKSGALHIVQSPNLGLLPAPIWGAGLVDVSNLKVDIEAGQDLMHVYGTLKSDTALPNCILVIIAKSPAAKGADADNEIKISPIPDTGKEITMPAGDTVLFDRNWSLLPQFDDTLGTWELHIFSDGVEIPTTLTKPEDIAAGRAKTEAYLLRDHPDSQIALVRGVRPIYPESLRAKNVAGSTTLRCLVDRDGNVATVTIVSATEPAFGTAAADAVRQWKFAPAVVNHHYVAETVEFPMNFTAPNP
jgi:TonB family protein